MDIALGVVAAFALVAANAFFVATEFALARTRTSQIADFEARGSRGAGALRHAIENIDAYLAACQLGITLASIGLGAIAKPAFEEVLAPISESLGRATGLAATTLAFAFAFAIVSLLHVVLGELAPKSLAISRTARTALVLAPPMRAFYLASKPFVDFFNWLGNLVLKPFGIPPAREAGHAPHSEDELRVLLEQSVNEGLIDPGERELAERAFLFGDLRVRQIMVPRNRIVALRSDEEPRTAALRAAEAGYTRLPVVEPDSDLDDAIGFANAKELLRRILTNEPVELRELAQPLHRVPDSMLVDELLHELRERAQHVALVVDEYGTTVGLVTLEDVIEEVVGEREPGFDAPPYVRADDGSIELSGTAPLALVSEVVGLRFDDAHEATIGGHVVDVLGRLPDAGEAVPLHGRTIEILAVESGRIERVRVLPDDSAP